MNNILVRSIKYDYNNDIIIKYFTLKNKMVVDEIWKSFLNGKYSSYRTGGQLFSSIEEVKNICEEILLKTHDKIISEEEAEKLRLLI